MHTPLVLDAGGPLLLLFLGVPIVIGALLLVVGLEAVLLRVLKWDLSLRRCILHAVAINAVSSLAGCVLVFLVQYLSFVPSSWVVPLILLAVALIVSVLLEWLVLRVLKPEQKQFALRAALIINLISYVLLGVIALIGANL